MSEIKMVPNAKRILTAAALLAIITACGVNGENSSPDIVGGRSVGANETGPENVSTVGLNGCTGTIIARDLILTAAHCFQSAMAGGYVLFGTQFNGSDRKIIKIASASHNPAYSGTHNDIAMLKLASEIPAGYKPVSILPPGIQMNRGEVVRQAGYGSNNQANSFGTLRTVESRLEGAPSSGSLFVANGRTAACSGDSGGPLYAVKNGKWYTIGITSTAVVDNARRCTGGNFYTSTAQNYNFIVDMARTLTGRQNPLVDTGSQKPTPEDLGGGKAPVPGAVRFLVLSDLSISGADLSIRVKNDSGRTVSGGIFILTPVRTLNNAYDISYDLELLMPQAAPNQEFILKFKDPYAVYGNLSAVKRFSVRMTVPPGS